MPALSLLSISPFPPMVESYRCPSCNFYRLTLTRLQGEKAKLSCLLVFATSPEALSLAELKQMFVADHRPLVPLTLASLEATHTCLAQPCIIIFCSLHPSSLLAVILGSTGSLCCLCLSRQPVLVRRMEDPAGHLSDVKIKVDFSANNIIFHLTTDNFHVVVYSPHVLGISLQICTQMNKKCLIILFA